MSGLPFEPWHMWGSAINVRMPGGVAAIRNQQIANVNYARPDSWSFFLAAELMHIAAAPITDIDFRCDFHLITGLGRTAFDNQKAELNSQTQPFCRIIIRLLAGQTVATCPQNKKWTTQTRSPLLEPADAASRLPLEHFPAQDIRCLATVSQDTAGAVIEATVQLTAMFAPRTHIRPEWFGTSGDVLPQFRGNENGGS